MRKTVNWLAASDRNETNRLAIKKPHTIPVVSPSAAVVEPHTHLEKETV